MLCNSEGDEESVDCGKMNQTHETLPCDREVLVSLQHTEELTPFESDTSKFLFIHTLPGVLKDNPR